MICGPPFLFETTPLSTFENYHAGEGAVAVRVRISAVDRIVLAHSGLKLLGGLRHRLNDSHRNHAARLNSRALPRCAVAKFRLMHVTEVRVRVPCRLQPSRVKAGLAQGRSALHEP